MMGRVWPTKIYLLKILKRNSTMEHVTSKAHPPTYMHQSYYKHTLNPHIVTLCFPNILPAKQLWIKAPAKYTLFWCKICKICKIYTAKGIVVIFQNSQTLRISVEKFYNFSNFPFKGASDCKDRGFKDGNKSHFTLWRKVAMLLLTIFGIWALHLM